MAFYYLDLLEKCVVAELTDPAQAQTLIAGVGPRYGVIETATALAAKAVTTLTSPAPAGGMEAGPDYGPLVAQGVDYTPLVVADVLADYDLTPAEIHCDAARYQLVTDASGFVRDVTRLSNVPPPKDFLRVTTDATDDNPPDGYPDISADGISTCRIMIQKVNGQTGADMAGAGDNDLIQIMTQAGKLSAVQVNLVNGYAEVVLTSATDTVITLVRAFDPGGVLEEGSVQVQFA
ncbi:MAG: hypothetical protein Fur0037_19070 [Planctomycetota bacterium]